VEAGKAKGTTTAASGDPRTVGELGSSIDGLVASPTPRTQEQKRASPQLLLFAHRCNEMAERIRVGEVPFVFGVDVLYDASIWSGLSDRFGDDVCQRIMADAFLARPPA
jgi:hypothetical protein